MHHDPIDPFFNFSALILLDSFNNAQACFTTRLQLQDMSRTQPVVIVVLKYSLPR